MICHQEDKLVDVLPGENELSWRDWVHIAKELSAFDAFDSVLGSLRHVVVEDVWRAHYKFLQQRGTDDVLLLWPAEESSFLLRIKV